MPIVCLSAGHGGSDPGAIGPSGLQEKDVTLKITLQCAKLLGAQGVTVVLTRDGDTDVSPKERAEFANSSGCNCFTEIHCNAATNPTAHGLETYYFRGSGDGKRLAEAILDKLVLETGLENRGTKEAGFAVLRLTDMTAALVECGFISNPAEEDLLQREDFQKKCAKAIADGIAAFLGLEKPGLDNILPWAKNTVEKAVSIGLVVNPELLNKSEQKVLVWFDRLGLLERKVIAGE